MGSAQQRRHIVVMGVSGCGKSLVGEALAERLGRPFAEADDFHPPANIAKMESGHALTDEDRWPWLRSLGAWMAEQESAGQQSVITCSALRRVYRDLLRESVDGVAFVHLHGDMELIAERMGKRAGHFMPTSLLQSQFDTLEPLEADEEGVVLDIAASPEELVEQAVSYAEGG